MCPSHSLFLFMCKPFSHFKMKFVHFNIYFWFASPFWNRYLCHRSRFQSSGFIELFFNWISFSTQSAFLKGKRKKTILSARSFVHFFMSLYSALIIIKCHVTSGFHTHTHTYYPHWYPIKLIVNTFWFTSHCQKFAHKTVHYNPNSPHGTCVNSSFISFSVLFAQFFFSYFVVKKGVWWRQT